ncbi:DUF2332 domain-containing protein [Luteococcus sp. H138]|uniref:DUF2332 domain-containing protein n=1 Tax=unclassified Luteococcus TaxID=2639923 RepID=UPI00313DE156
MKGVHMWADASIAELYEWFGDETAPTSPVWGAVCRWVAHEPELAALLDPLPGTKRQPNLFLGALRYLDAPLEPGPGLLDFVRQRWPEIERIILTRATQTNEPARCAGLVPALGLIEQQTRQPLALIEVGCSAGLCLFPDHYGYRWEQSTGVVEVRPTEQAPVFRCEVTGPAPLPTELPRIGWRVGIDLNPLDPADESDARWLRALVWPGQEDRERRLAACLELTAGLPAQRVRGNALAVLEEVVDAVPDGMTPVLLHSAALAYFQREDRARFVELVQGMRSRGVRWLSSEGEKVLRPIRDRLAEHDAWQGDPSFVIALDAHPLARVAPHGQWLAWLSSGNQTVAASDPIEVSLPDFAPS